MSRHAFAQLRVDRGILGGCEGELARLDSHDQEIRARIGFDGAVPVGRTDRDRAGRPFMVQPDSPDTAVEPKMRGQLQEDQMLLRRRLEARCAL